MRRESRVTGRRWVALGSCGGVVAVVAGCPPRRGPGGASAASPSAQAQSELFLANQAWLRRPSPARPAREDPTRIPAGQSLIAYAEECDAATGIRVPAFNCNDGVEVPGQGQVPAGHDCDQP